MAYYGLGLETAIKKLNFEFRLTLKKRGGTGVRSFKVIFRNFDQNGNGKLDSIEFEAALAQLGLFPKKVELQALMKYYDTDKDGNISYEEFLRGLREPMNERRSRIVEKAYATLDRDGSGTLTIKDIEKIYSVTNHKDFISGKKTKEQLLTEFLNNFEGPQGNRDGVVTKEEFFDYYNDLSMTISNDDLFVTILENAWMISEDETVPAFKSQLEKIEIALKTKLQTMSKKSDSVLLKKMFGDFDRSKSGTITLDEFSGMLAKLGISVERKYLVALFNKLDTKKVGVVEFGDFFQFVCEVPYKG